MHKRDEHTDFSEKPIELEPFLANVFGVSANFDFICAAFFCSIVYRLMAAVKVNIFISHAPEDKAVADTLQEWLYPMRDEVNVWHYNPPKKPELLSLSWRLLLPWYQPVDPQVLYEERLVKRRENAHIYLFLTSYKSINSQRVEDDITLAVGRRIDCAWDELAPLILPVLISPSRWKEESRLAKFEPLAKGVPLSKFPKAEDGFLMLADQIAGLAKVIQTRLNEAQYYQTKPSKGAMGVQPSTRFSLPYLGEQPEQFNFNPPAPFSPPDWMGWCIIALIFTISLGGFRKNHPAVSALHLKARPDKEFQVEYPREIPVVPNSDTIKYKFPPVE